MNNRMTLDADDAGEEMPLMHVFSFFRRNWLLILVSALLGGSIGAFLELQKPQLYEAIAIINGIPVGERHDGRPGAVEIGGGMPLDLAEVVVWLDQDTIYNAATTQSCGLAQDKAAASALRHNVTAEIVKGAPQLLQIRVRGSDAEQAKECGHVIFGLIQSYQKVRLAPYLAEAEKQVAKFDEASARNQEDIKKLDRYAQQVAYLATRDQLFFSQMQAEEWHRKLSFYASRQASLIAPIPDPIKLPRRVAFFVLLGSVAAGMLGMLLALCREQLKQ